MSNLKEYIKLSIRNLAKQQERREAKENKGEKLDDKIIEMFDKFRKGDYSAMEFSEVATDLMMANIFDEAFFEELMLREEEGEAERQIYEKLTKKEIEAMEPIDIAKLTKEYIEKKGLFEDEQ